MFPIAAIANRAQVTLPSGDTIQSLLNAQKLSLPANTPLGTRVKVTDGFVVSASTGVAANGFYAADGTTENGKPVYIKQPIDNSDVNGLSTRVHYTGAAWALYLNVDEGDSFTAGAGSEAFPWLADWTADTSDRTLTHPAVQELTAPPTAQGGVFVSGGSQDGIWPKFATQYQGKDAYGLLGVTDGSPQDAGSLFWEVSGYPNPLWLLRDSGSADLYYSLSDVATPDLAGSDKFVMAVSGVAYSKRGTFNGKSYYNVIGQSASTALSAIFWSSATWHITNAIGVDLDTSTSAVATPDLATFLLGTVVTNTAWLNASDDSPASITVSSVTQGELDAGVLVAGAGTSGTNGVYPNIGNIHGFGSYKNLTGTFYIGVASGEWDLTDAVDPTVANNFYYVSGALTAIPSTLPTVSDGSPPAPTVSRDDVASESNWSNV